MTNMGNIMAAGMLKTLSLFIDIFEIEKLPNIDMLLKKKSEGIMIIIVTLIIIIIPNAFCIQRSFI